jgi:hypothetical protein
MRYRRKCGSNWGCYYFLFEKKTLQRFVQCHAFAQSTPRRRPSDILSALRTALDLYKNASFAALCGSKGNSYTVSTQSDMFIYICTYSTQYRDAGRAQEVGGGGEEKQ